MKFAIATVAFWEALGYDTANWRKSNDGNQAITELKYAEILGVNLRENPEVKIYFGDNPELIRLLESAEWHRDGTNGPFDSYNLLEQLAEVDTRLTTAVAEVIDGEAERVSAEDAREVTYNALVADVQANVDAFDVALEDGIVAENLAVKLAEKEATYAPRLTAAEQQLEQAATKIALETEKARIDAFTTLASGSTTGDAELIDGRVGADAVTYANIGAAIRGQFTKTNNALSDFKDDVSIFIEPKNMLNTADINYKVGYYVNPTTGALVSSSGYDTTGHINVTSGKKIILTTGSTRVKNYMRFIAAYDSAGNIMASSGSSVDTLEYVVPTDVHTVLVSFLNRADIIDRMISQVDISDESLPDYELYFDSFFETKVSTDTTLAIANKPADAKTVGDALAEINGNLVYKKPSAKNTATALSANVAISIPEFPEMLKTGQSFSYSAKFTTFGNSDMISVGFMNPAYGTYQSWMEISFDRVKWMLSGTSAILDNLHGLTISDYLTVSVEVSQSTAQIKFTITTTSGSYSFTQVSDSTRLNAIGTLTAKATMATTDIILSGTCKQFKYHTWLLGDSYFGNGLDRIGGRLIEWGYAGGVLFDGLGGLNSEKGYAELQKLLTYGTPKTLVWYLGMNDNATTVSTYFPLVEQLCDANGIELIFNKIPFVPSRLVENEAVNNYVLASGRRYVDSYAAVGANPNGVWYAGHLNADGVHPDPLGAAALTSRLIADVPEILSASN